MKDIDSGLRLMLIVTALIFLLLFFERDSIKEFIAYAHGYKVSSSDITYRYDPQIPNINSWYINQKEYLSVTLIPGFPPFSYEKEENMKKFNSIWPKVFTVTYGDNCTQSHTSTTTVIMCNQ